VPSGCVKTNSAFTNGIDIDIPPRSRIVGAHNRLIFEGMQP
jgi:hypothetical protein